MKQTHRLLCVVALLMMAESLFCLAVHSRRPHAGGRSQMGQNDVPEQIPQLQEILQLRLGPQTVPLFAGEHGPGPRITLTNTSSEPIEIRYGYWPYIYLSYLVMNEKGELLLETSFAELASIVDKPSNLRIESREAWSSTPHLSPFRLAEVSGKPLAPGKYRVQGVFRYHDLVVRSNIITMTLKPKPR